MSPLWNPRHFVLVLACGIVLGTSSAFPSALILVAAIAAVLAVFIIPPQPWLYGALFFLPFTRLLTVEVGFSLQPSYVLLFGCLGSLLVRRDGFAVKRSERWLILYVMVAFVSIVQSINLPSTQGLQLDFKDLPYWRSVTQWAWLLLAVIFYKLTYELCSRQMHVFRQALYSLGAGALVASMYGLLDWVAYYAGWKNTLVITDVYGFVARVSGPAKEPILFAHYLLIPLFILAFGAFNKRFWYVALAATIAAFVLTFSLGAFAAGLGALILCVPVLRNVQRAAVLKVLLLVFTVGAVVFGAALFMLPGHFDWSYISDKLMAVVNPDKYQNWSVSERQAFYTSAWRAFLLRPLLGVGIGNFGFYYPYLRPVGSLTYSHLVIPNSLPLDVLSETGVIGMTAFLGWNWTVVKRALTVFRQRESMLVSEGFHTGLLIAFIAVMLQFLSLSPYYVAYVWVLYGLINASTDLSSLSRRVAVNGAAS